MTLNVCGLTFVALRGLQRQVLSARPEKAQRVPRTGLTTRAAVGQLERGAGRHLRQRSGVSE